MNYTDGELTSPFWDEQLLDIKSVKDKCCHQPNLIKDNGANVCKNCGSVHGYKPANGYIDFHENKYRIRCSEYYGGPQRSLHIILQHISNS